MVISIIGSVLFLMFQALRSKYMGHSREVSLVLLGKITTVCCRVAEWRS